MFKKTDKKDLYDEESNQKEVARSLEELEKLLKSAIQLAQNKRGKEYERLEHTVGAHRDHVLLMMLKNNKSKK